MMCPVAAVNPGGAGASRLQKRRKRRCINAARSPGTTGTLKCTRACTHIRAISVSVCLSRYASRGSPGETTSRLSNCRSCIMHRSLCRYLPFSRRSPRSHLPGPALVSRFPPSPRRWATPASSDTAFSRRSPESKLPKFRGRSCESAGISCNGEILYQISPIEYGGCQRERATGGWGKRSDHERGSRQRTRVQACTRLLRWKQNDSPANGDSMPDSSYASSDSLHFLFMMADWRKESLVLSRRWDTASC